MKQVQMTLTEKTPLTADVWQLRFAGDTSPITHPGQFVNLELPLSAQTHLRVRLG